MNEEAIDYSIGVDVSVQHWSWFIKIYYSIRS